MNKKCPNCGSREIGQDSLNAQACLRLISTKGFRQPNDIKPTLSKFRQNKSRFPVR
ncbi:hypothetical protein [Bacillus mycoides]|uniref:hypothetical protein n=1 Tax=Bacillus mycoides TaxID=1405 RepID=UPI003D1EC6CC